VRRFRGVEGAGEVVGEWGGSIMAQWRRRTGARRPRTAGGAGGGAAGGCAGKGRRPEVEEALTCGPHTSAGERGRGRGRGGGPCGPETVVGRKQLWTAAEKKKRRGKVRRAAGWVGLG
jgi:hypothetical protein